MDLWREALERACVFRKLAPWQWMDDTAISVFIDGDNAPWFACVLGGGGEVFGLVLYRGEEGLRALCGLHQAGREPDVEDARFAQSAIDVTFGPKSALDRHDLARLAALGYAPARGSRLAWPSFRRHRPGLVQWHPDEAELRVLVAALPVVCCFAECLRGSGDAYATRGAWEFPILPHNGPIDSPNALEWRHWLPPQEKPRPVVRVNSPEAVATFRGLPRQPGLVLELDLFRLPASQCVEDGCAFYPQHLVIARGDNGVVVGMEILHMGHDGTLQLANAALSAFQRLGVRPAVLRFQRRALAEAFLPLAEQLDIPRVELAEQLSAVAEFRYGMEGFLGR